MLLSIRKKARVVRGHRPSKKLARGRSFLTGSALCLLACGSPGGKERKESLAAQGSRNRRTRYRFRNQNRRVAALRCLPRVFRQSDPPAMGRVRALRNTGMDAAPANNAALVRGKRGVAQGLGALPLKPWQEAVPPAPPVFQHAGGLPSPSCVCVSSFLMHRGESAPPPGRLHWCLWGR